MSRYYLLGICLATAASITMDSTGAALAATLHPGDILVATRQGTNGAIYQVDPVTGVYTVISDNTHGSGPALQNATSVTMASDGDLWVTSTNGIVTGPQITKVDPTTGNRVAVPGVPPDALIMAREFNGSLIITAIHGLYVVNPVSGAVTPIAGSGLPLFTPGGFSIVGSSAFVADTLNLAVTRVDLVTGARTFFSIPGGIVNDVAIESASSLLTAGYTSSNSILSPQISRVDMATGHSVVVSSPTVGGGVTLQPPFVNPNGPLQLVGVAAGADGFIYTSATGAGLSEILKVDPITGDRQLLANMAAVSDYVGYLTIVPANVPEPSTLALGACGALALLAVNRGRRR